MEPQFWRNRWHKSEIGWHEGRTNASLARHWVSLALPVGSRVLVPLCGKSLDLTWLAGQGHKVTGIELSAIAAADYFAEQGLTPARTQRDAFEVYVAGNVEIWCGDLFQLQPGHVADIAAAYDRAALYAMPPELQPAYAAKMAEIVPRDVPILQVTFDSGETPPAGPPFSTPPARVRGLYERHFDITELETSPSTDISPNMRLRGISQVALSVMVLRRR